MVKNGYMRYTGKSLHSNGLYGQNQTNPNHWTLPLLDKYVSAEVDP
jgi:hypothetical protein